jgi:hypothetical protein
MLHLNLAVVVTAANLPQISRAVALVLDAAQRMHVRIPTDSEKYLVARVSGLGWKLVSNLEALLGTKGMVRMVAFRAKEKAYIQYVTIVDRVIKFPASSGVGGGKWRG